MMMVVYCLSKRTPLPNTLTTSVVSEKLNELLSSNLAGTSVAAVLAISSASARSASTYHVPTSLTLGMDRAWLGIVRM